MDNSLKADTQAEIIKLWDKVNLDSDIPARGGIMMELDRLISVLKNQMETKQS